VTLPEPALDDGALADDEPVLDEPVLDEPVLDEPVPDEPVPDEPVPDEEPVPDDELPELPVACDDDPEPVLADAAPAVAWVELGRVKASPPATARPSTPAPAVTPRSRLRARSRRTTADTVRGSLLFIMSPSRTLTPPEFPNGLCLGCPVHLRRL
jgi:hypothetical protein